MAPVTLSELIRRLLRGLRGPIMPCLPDQRKRNTLIMAAIDTGTRVRARALEVIGQQCFAEDIGYGQAVSIDVDNGQSHVVYQLFCTKQSPILGQGKC